MRAALVLTLGLASPAWADAPRVIADIPPVHSLAAMVMDGVGTPDLLLPPGASPHEFSLRPSDAASLQAADLVLWVGPNLTPWLEETKSSLAPDAMSLELFSVAGTLHLPFRETPVFALSKDDDHDHDHDHGHDHGAEHDDEHGDEHSAENKDDHDHDHGEEHSAGHDDHGHDHSEEDPHAWLDPVNAGLWLEAIADALGEIDPDNAQTYRANALDAKTKIETMTTDIDADLAAVGDISFVVYHDAYQYFENRFGLQTRGAIAIGDATDPSAARVDAVRDMVSDNNIACVFAEPQFNPSLINAVFEEADVKVGVIDPVGSLLEPGPELYPQLLSEMTQALAGCGAN